MSKIEWCDRSANPVKGLCPVGCSYCYARRMYDRNLNPTFKDKSIRYEPSAWSDKFKDGERVFVGSTIDLFHDKTIYYFDDIALHVHLHPKTTFIFLTKCPQNLPKEWPDNCWVGVSATSSAMLTKSWAWLKEVQAKVKFVSLEPLQYWDMSQEDAVWTFKTCGINWIIIGQQTPVRPATTPKIEWIKEIVDAADKACIPVFLKNNLESLFILQRRKTFVCFKPEVAENIDTFYPVVKRSRHLRQEFPHPPAGERK